MVTCDSRNHPFANVTFSEADAAEFDHARMPSVTLGPPNSHPVLDMEVEEEDLWLSSDHLRIENRRHHWQKATRLSRPAVAMAVFSPVFIASKSDKDIPAASATCAGLAPDSSGFSYKAR